MSSDEGDHMYGVYDQVGQTAGNENMMQQPNPGMIMFPMPNMVQMAPPVQPQHQVNIRSDSPVEDGLRTDTNQMALMTNELKSLHEKISSMSSDNLLRNEAQNPKKDGFFCSYSKLFITFTFVLAAYAAIMGTLSYMTINNCNCSGFEEYNPGTEAFKNLHPDDIFNCKKMSFCLSNITDNLCDTIDGFCELQPITTSNPSLHPSGAPTDSPSIDPSPAPTPAPTNQPSGVPTDSPSTDPTPAPTNDPSGTPTYTPTNDPSKSPTLEPTSSPTVEPTVDPTINPSANPSNMPTIAPTDLASATVFNARSWNLPVSGNSVDANPIHIKTNWNVGATMTNCMYNIEFKGHVFQQSKPIFTVAIGYLSSTAQALTYNGIYNVFGANSPVTITTYVSSDGKLVFKLVLATETWHASDLTMNLIGGLSSYHVLCMNTFDVLSISHSTSNL